MPTKTKDIPELEVAAPIEVFQPYFEEKQEEREGTKFGIVTSLVLMFTLAAVLIALPLTIPALLGGSAAIMLVLGIVYGSMGAIASLFAPFFWPKNFKYHINLEEKNMQFTFTNHSHIKLSQVNKNGVEHTLISTDKDPSNSIRDHILGNSFLQEDILSMIEGTIKELEAEKTKLANKEAKLKNQMENTSVEYLERLGVLSERMKTVKQQITSNDQKLSALKDVLPNAKLKQTVESKYRQPIRSLFNFLEYHKKDIISIKEKKLQAKEEIEQLKKERIKHPDLDSVFSEKINALETKLKSKRSELTEELNKIFKAISKVEEEYKNKLKDASDTEQVTINFMLDEMHSKISAISEAFLEVDPEFYLEYFEKEAKEHYSHLLADPNTNQETLTLLNQILSDYPLPNEAIHQHINHILADYSGAVQFSDKTPKTDAPSAPPEIVPPSASPSHRK